MHFARNGHRSASDCRKTRVLFAREMGVSYLAFIPAILFTSLDERDGDADLIWRIVSMKRGSPLSSGPWQFQAICPRERDRHPIVNYHLPPSALVEMHSLKRRGLEAEDGSADGRPRRVTRDEYRMLSNDCCSRCSQRLIDSFAFRDDADPFPPRRTRPIPAIVRR